MPPELSVVIPAHNEERRLGPTLERVVSYLGARALAHEVLVADDGSTDGTGACAAAWQEHGVRLLRDPVNRGKGAALRRGVAASRGRRVLLTDADLSTPIDDLERLEARMDRAEVIFGSRAVAGSAISVHQPLYRELLGKSFNRFIRFAGVASVRDTQCGFKLLDGAAARRLFAELVTDGFAFDVELAWLARRRGYQVEEVGVRWANSADSRVRALPDGLAMIAEVVRFRWHHRRGH